MPEEDRMFAYYVLQWIAFRNEVPLGKAFPYMALVGAAEASMLRLTGVKPVRLYDRNGLADVCGCLISIGSLQSFSKTPREDEIDDVNDGVTFAHYSVQEYLDSNSDLNSIFGHHTLVGEDLSLHLLDIILTESQQLDEDELSSISSIFTGQDDASQHSLDITTESQQPGEDELSSISSSFMQDATSQDQAILYSCRNFRIYSISLACMSLYCFCNHIWHSEAFKALTIDILDPSKPIYPIMEKLTYWTVALKSILPQERIRHGYDIWYIRWNSKTE